MKMNLLNIYFDSPKAFELRNIKPLAGIVGLYFIFSSSISIQYPYTTSRLLYIGMSEKKTNSMGNRLEGHYKGTSKNVGLVNYKKIEPLLFTYINFDIIKSNWKYRIEDLESYFILDFVDKHGVYPICNNKTGFEVQNSILQTEFKIDWSYFK
jgi:hypothetical protein